MASILLIPSRITKDQFLEIAVTLNQNDHVVRYATFLPVESEVRARGVEFVALDRPGDTAPEPPLRRPLPGPLGRAQRLLTRWIARRSRRDAEAERLGLPALVETLEKLAPDLVLVDIELSGHIIAALSARRPVVLVTTLLSLWRRPGLPPQNMQLSPPDGDTTASKRFRVAWLRLYAWKWWQRQSLYLRRPGKDTTAVLRQFAERHGLRWPDLVDHRQWLMPFTFCSLPVIDLNVRELDYPHVPVPHVRYVGPVICRNRISVAKPDEREQSELDHLIEQRRANGDRRLLYCSFGRFEQAYEDSMLTRVISACKQRPEWTLVIALGASDSPRPAGELPENVHMFTWLPQLRVLEFADCAIIHGGISSVNECIYRKVPMVLYAPRHLDQPGNAARAAWHRLGVRGDRDNDTTDDVIAHIESAMNDEVIRNRLGEMRARFDASADNGLLLAAIDEFLQASEVEGTPVPHRD